ncbi:MAG: acetyl-CoA carboxylase carboxyl transferase subunit alpha/beta [Deltaproteobacteria bacterium]|jgi:acetyl-CoA carboxylase carboxyl transferase subunit beta|nr:acetyl-CoA carboxylase carboxyl transferase subunit alpha/beta [Deltaproteobacteria bacterium]
MEQDKLVLHLAERLAYIRDIFGEEQRENIRILADKLEDYHLREPGLTPKERRDAVLALEDLFGFVERKLEEALAPMNKVRIVRHPQRICLRDILENVYDNYTEIGGQDEHSIDPAIVIARAYMTRKLGRTTLNQSVMVIGHEKGHGQEFRNGGSAKPWGNAKALQYMRVAETENIPIHTYVFTPGAYPVEDTPGAAQQIAANLYGMSSLRVPVIAVFSEGGSGGAEAIALADTRLMFSHGYYSVISPEGAAAIEGRVRDGRRVSPELVSSCAVQMKITAQDNLRMGYIDRVIQEPCLGARPHHYEFFRALRQELLRATDEVALTVRGLAPIRIFALRSRRKQVIKGLDFEKAYVRWNLSQAAKIRLINKRHKKFRNLSRQAAPDYTPLSRRLIGLWQELSWGIYSSCKYNMLRRHRQRVSDSLGELKSEWNLFVERALAPLLQIFRKLRGSPSRAKAETARQLTELSAWNEDLEQRGHWIYVSPKAREDKAVTCPNHREFGCVDIWAPDLYGEFAGVCPNCGHHFPMEYQWYLHNIFDPGSFAEFSADVEASNPLDMPALEVKLAEAREKTGHRSGCLTFEARIHNIKLVVALFMGSFRNGTVGAAEGEKFIRAAERAKRKRFPFLAYVHATGGIRIQEGTNGLIQMPRCTMAVRRYIDAGGLYLVTYDTNSYAGPVASFLGCSPYQFGIRSANVGFAGPRVIAETTGLALEPHYHNVYKALARGHIQGIWDRREVRSNLHQAFQTMGGRNLYYK